MDFADYVIGRDDLEEPLQTVDAESGNERNPKSGKFLFLPFHTFLISSTELLRYFHPKHHFRVRILRS
jgi:hypothetical protein